MLRPTYLSVKQKVERDLDLEGETFISDEEILGYCNEAIDDAEAEIHKINEDYFLTKYSVPLVQGTSVYDMPTDIYANKIRGVTYSNGSDVYPVTRIRGSHKFSTIAFINQAGASDDYRYELEHDALLGMQFVLYPAARTTDSTVMKLWYIRNAATVALDTDTIDIPEFVNFIYQHMKWRCYEKEGHPNTPDAVVSLEKQRALMIQTLTDMVPDEDDTIEQDMSHYWEMS